MSCIYINILTDNKNLFQKFFNTFQLLKNVNFMVQSEIVKNNSIVNHFFGSSQFYFNYYLTQVISGLCMLCKSWCPNKNNLSSYGYSSNMIFCLPILTHTKTLLNDKIKGNPNMKSRPVKISTLHAIHGNLPCKIPNFQSVIMLGGYHNR